MTEEKTSATREVAHSFLKRFMTSFCIILLLGCTVLFCLWQHHLYKQAVQQDLAHIARTRFTIASFPYYMTLNSKTASVEDITFLELYGDHGYYGYLVITLDRHNLSDDDVYWMLNGSRYNWELDTSAHLSPYSHNNDLVPMDFLGCRYTDTHVYFFYTTDLYRYSLEGSYISAAVTYLPDGTDISDQQIHRYTFDFTGDKYHNSLDCLTIQELRILTELMVDTTQ